MEKRSIIWKRLTKIYSTKKQHQNIKGHQMDINLLLMEPESDYLDFKEKWYSGDKGTFDLIRDILCLSNSLSNSVFRYIIIGIKEEKAMKSGLKT